MNCLDDDKLPVLKNTYSKKNRPNNSKSVAAGSKSKANRIDFGREDVNISVSRPKSKSQGSSPDKNEDDESERIIEDSLKIDEYDIQQPPILDDQIKVEDILGSSDEKPRIDENFEVDAAKQVPASIDQDDSDSEEEERDDINDYLDYVDEENDDLEYAQFLLFTQFLESKLISSTQSRTSQAGMISKEEIHL